MFNENNNSIVLWSWLWILFLIFDIQSSFNNFNAVLFILLTIIHLLILLIISKFVLEIKVSLNLLGYLWMSNHLPQMEMHWMLKLPHPVTKTTVYKKYLVVCSYRYWRNPRKLCIVWNWTSHFYGQSNSSWTEVQEIQNFLQGISNTCIFCLVKKALQDSNGDFGVFPIAQI